MTELLLSSGYWALLLTVAAYQLGLWVRKKTGSPLLHPILVAVAVIVPFLLLTGLPNDEYQKGMQSISWLLTPCTVCLGIPLYTQLSRLKKHISAIFAGILGGSVTSMLLVWVVDMLYQLFPIRKRIPLGSQKLFGFRFVAIEQLEINTEKLKNYITNTTKSAYRVALVWVAFIAGIALLYFKGVIGKIGMFLISVAFYVCDLICVLVWCPFRLMMKNRCCTTCRIFNWDHLMMFSPLVFIGGFYSVSLVVLAVAAFLLWEACVMLFPERFWEFSNDALKCVNCTDKLCTQYCQKLR